MFRCCDGAVQIAVGSPQLWARLSAAFALDQHDVGFATNTDRVRNRAALIEVVEAAFTSATSEDLLADLAGCGVPAGKVRSLDEVYAWDQVVSQGLSVCRSSTNDSGP